MLFSKSNSFIKKTVAPSKRKGGLTISWRAGLTDAVDALDEPDEAAKADRERRLILNAEVPSMMTGMVASVVEEHRLAAMFLNATDQHRAVFTADFGIHVDDAVDARNLSCDFLDNGNSFFVASVGHGLAHAGEFVVDAVSCGKAP